MNIFYSTSAEIEQGNLSKEESFHFAKVLRGQAGDKIQVVDGLGSLYICEITVANPKQTEFEIIEKKEAYNKRLFKLTIAIAPTKNLDRMEWFVEKATEIGVDTIAPIYCQNSERKVLKTERLIKKALSAMKQSQKAYLPEVEELIGFKSFIKQQFDGEKYIAHCYDNPKDDLSTIYQKGSNALVLIGPEGDFSEEEVREAIENGFKPVNLSSSRLRTETAGIIACSTINLINGC